MPSKAGAAAPRGGAGGAKRAVDSHRAAPEPKKAKLDPLEEKLTVINQALENALALSETSREMLRVMSWGCLNTPADVRHEYQDAVSRMICQVLVAAEASVQSEKQNAAMEVCRAMAGKAKNRGSRATAEALLRECTSSLEETKAKWREDNLALQAARKSLDAARGEQARLDAPQLDAAKKSSLVQVALTEHIPKLADDASPDLGSHVAELTSICEKIDLDESLTKAFPVAGRKRASARSTFERAVLVQLEVELGKRATTLAAMASSSAEGSVARAAKVAVAQAALEAARQQQATSASNLRREEVEKREAEADVFDAETVDHRADAELQRAEHTHAAAERELADFRSGPLHAFDVLFRRVSESTDAATPSQTDAPTVVPATVSASTVTVQSSIATGSPPEGPDSSNPAELPKACTV